MPEDDHLPLSLRQVEQRLISLLPVATRIDRDRLMYEAGRGAAGRGARDPLDTVTRYNLRTWKRATAALATCLVISLSTTVHAYLTWPNSEQETAEVSVAVPDRAASQATLGPSGRDIDAPRLESQVVSSARALVERRSTDPPRRAPYLYQRDVALRRGIDAIPTLQPAAVASSPAPTVRDLQERMLPPPVGRHGGAI